MIAIVRYRIAHSLIELERIIIALITGIIIMFMYIAREYK